MPRRSSETPRNATASADSTVAARDKGLGEAAMVGPPVARTRSLRHERAGHHARKGWLASGAQHGECRSAAVGQHHRVSDMRREPERHEDDTDREQRSGQLGHGHRVRRRANAVTGCGATSRAVTIASI